jgi:hypothetical protein
MQMPVFLVLFFAPVYVPLSLLSGWIHTVAAVEPLTRVLESAAAFSRDADAVGAVVIVRNRHRSRRRVLRHGRFAVCGSADARPPPAETLRLTSAWHSELAVPGLCKGTGAAAHRVPAARPP